MVRTLFYGLFVLGAGLPALSLLPPGEPPHPAALNGTAGVSFDHLASVRPRDSAKQAPAVAEEFRRTSE